MNKLLKELKFESEVFDQSNEQDLSDAIISSSPILNKSEIDLLSRKCNAPMLITLILQNINEGLTLMRGLELILSHLETSDGCILMLKNNLVDALINVTEYNKNDDKIELLCLKIFKQLLDCNFTRDHLSFPKLVDINFYIGYYHMNSIDHVALCCRNLTQLCRQEICRQYILDKELLMYCALFCKRNSSHVQIVRSILKLFNWVATTDQRLAYVCQQYSAVKLTLKCMKINLNQAQVLAPAMLFLTRASLAYPPCIDILLKYQAVPTVINALKMLHSDEEIQLRGLRMLQLLSQTSEGWNQISQTRNGWQSICQGNIVGDALVHELPGTFHNRGWCIGESAYLPAIERNKRDARIVQQKLKPYVQPKEAWTVHSLREFMGLDINNRSTLTRGNTLDIFFEILTTLDLLPLKNESQDKWFRRIAVYERESKMKIEELAETIAAIRVKEAQEKKQKQEAIEREAIKPIYVMGQKISFDNLAKRDSDLKEQLKGLIDISS